MSLANWSYTKVSLLSTLSMPSIIGSLYKLHTATASSCLYSTAYIKNRLLYQHDVRRICHKLVRCKVSTTPSVRVREINQKRLRWRGLLRAEFRFIRTHTGITIQTFQQTMPSLSFVYQYNAVRGIMN